MTEIPWKALVLPQLFNFILFVGVLIYFARKPINELLERNANKFSENRKKAERERAEVETRLHEIKNKLREFEKTTGAAVSAAEKEARTLGLQMIEEAKKTAERQSADAEAMAQYEFVRAANDLRIEVVQAATEYAGTLLKTRTDDNLKSKLNSEFIRKVKAT